jgi:hypothetical protein
MLLLLRKGLSQAVCHRRFYGQVDEIKEVVVDFGIIGDLCFSLPGTSWSDRLR